MKTKMNSMTRKSPLPDHGHAPTATTTTQARAQKLGPDVEKAITVKYVRTLQELPSNKFAQACSVLVRMVPEDNSLTGTLLAFLAAVYRAEREELWPAMMPVIEAITQIDTAADGSGDRRFAQRLNLLCRLQLLRESAHTSTACNSPA